MPRTPETPRDFPFRYATPLGWLLPLLGCVIGFAALLYLPEQISGRSGRWLSVALFAALPLLGLAAMAGRRWTEIFRRPTARDIWIGLAFAPLTLLASAAAALLVMRVSLTAANPTAQMLTTLPASRAAEFIASTAPQLLGEELVTIVPLLAILSLLSRFGAPHRIAVGVAWIASSLIFGALHLSTYQWHVGQALLIIGAARMVLTASYLLTRNLWTSVIAHLTNDWSIFAVVLLANALAHS